MEAKGGAAGQRRWIVRGDKKQVVKTPENTERVELPELRIVAAELWARTQARFGTHKTPVARSGRAPSGLMIGNMECGTCHARMGIAGRDKCYKCSRRHQSGKSTCTNAITRPAEALDEAIVAAVLAVLDHETLVDDVLAAYAARVAGPVRADERGALETRVAVLTKEIDNLANAVAGTTNPAVVRTLLAALEVKTTELDDASAALATMRARPAPVALDPARLRELARGRVVRLADFARADITAGREAMREVLAGPVEAVPIRINGAPRFLIRGQLSAAGALGEPLFNTNGDPNGI